MSISNSSIKTALHLRPNPFLMVPRRFDDYGVCSAWGNLSVMTGILIIEYNCVLMYPQRDTSAEGTSQKCSKRHVEVFVLSAVLRCI